jgi:hypothetical protein
MTGTVGNKYWFDKSLRWTLIPAGVNLTISDGGFSEFMEMQLNKMARQIEAATIAAIAGRCSN